MNNKKNLKELLEADARKYIGDRAASSWERMKLLFTHTSYKYTNTLRKANYYKQNGNKLKYYLYRYNLLKLSIKYGYQIGIDAQVAGGLYLGHRGAIIVNRAVVAGKNISLAPGVTIGQENRGVRKGVPTLQNQIWIGTNAVVVGNITIGDDVLIAPNAYVNFDVPSHSVVIGNPAKIISKEWATEGYL